MVTYDRFLQGGLLHRVMTVMPDQNSVVPNIQYGLTPHASRSMRKFLRRCDEYSSKTWKCLDASGKSMVIASGGNLALHYLDPFSRTKSNDREKTPTQRRRRRADHLPVHRTRERR